MTDHTAQGISKGERAVMKQRLVRIAQLIEEKANERQVLIDEISKLRDEQGRLNAKVYSA